MWFLDLEYQRRCFLSEDIFHTNTAQAFIKQVEDPSSKIKMSFRFAPLITIPHLLPARWRYGLKCWFSLLWLCRETCSSKNSSLHFHIVMRVQALPNTVVGILPLWDDGSQTTEHPEQTKQQGKLLLNIYFMCVSVSTDLLKLCTTSPQSDGSGHRIVAMDDWKHPFNKLIHVENLLQMFLTLLCYFQHTQTQKVVAEERYELLKTCLRHIRTD